MLRSDKENREILADQGALNYYFKEPGILNILGSTESKLFITDLQLRSPAMSL